MEEELKTLPASPGEIELQGDKPTAKELEKIMDHWLVQAAEDGRIRTLGSIAKFLGDDLPLEATGYPSWMNVYTMAKVIKVENITIQYMEFRLVNTVVDMTGALMFGLLVTRDEGTEDEFRLVRASYTMDWVLATGEKIHEALADCYANQKYIPGDWEGPVLKLKDQADKIIVKQARNHSKRDRDVLLTRMGLKQVAS